MTGAAWDAQSLRRMGKWYEKGRVMLSTFPPLLLVIKVTETVACCLELLTHPPRQTSCETMQDLIALVLRFS